MEYASIVIPTHNRRDLLKQTLGAVFDQVHPKDKYEIVVVGDSTDGTSEEMEELSKRAPVSLRYIQMEPCGTSRKRNRGIGESKGSIIAFIDDDCFPDKNWLREIVLAFEENPIAAGIEGKTTRDEKLPVFYHATENLAGGNFQTCNVAYRKKVLEGIGGFDEGYHFFREDTDLAFRVQEEGEIIFHPQAVVYHPARRVGILSSMKELFMIREEVRLLRKFPQKYNEKFGLVGGGGLKKGIIGWVLLISLILSITLSKIAISLLILAGMLFFKYKVDLRKRTYTLFTGTIFILMSFVRDLLYPLFLLYYLAAVKIYEEF